MPYATYAQKSNRFLYDACPFCDGVKSKTAKLCYGCLRKRSVERHSCPECGRPMKGHHVGKPCWDCYRAKVQKLPHPCIDCGKPLSSRGNSGHAKRCRECSVKAQRSRPVRLCSIPGCERPHKAKGYCWSHYNKLVAPPRPYAKYRRTKLARLLDQQPCQVCGYSRMNSELHKITPALGYRPGNMVAVCVRCHREIERGLTPCPTPFTEEQILQFA